MVYDVKKIVYQNLLENIFLLSFISGVVIVCNYDSGDMYSGGNLVLIVEKIILVKFLINVFEVYFIKVKKGVFVNVKFDVYGDEVFEGKISLIYLMIDLFICIFQVEI